jgi:hypothetical protein
LPAGSHHHPVEPVLLDHLPHGLQRVGGAAEGVVVGIGHPRQSPGIVAHLLHVHHPGDVDPAVADEDADAGLLLGNIPFLGIFQLGKQGAPDLT